MKIYCMSDIHACLESFEAALENVICHLDEDDTMLLLLGDYVHGGDSGRGVLDKIMHLQEQYGNDKVMALVLQVFYSLQNPLLRTIFLSIKFIEDKVGHTFKEKHWFLCHSAGLPALQTIVFLFIVQTSRIGLFESLL